MRSKKILSGLTSLALSLSAFAGLPGAGLSVNAAQANWKFDFGGKGAASGYTGVSAADGYSAAKGYGFGDTKSVANVNANGSGALSDAVKFNNGNAKNTFNVDLPKGLYQVKVITGNAPRTTIVMEGMLQMINLTGNNAVETIQIPVTDGQLNVQAVAGMSGREYSISAMEITQINTTGEMKPTIWICGDSTVCNYYNSADTAQHGWGQFLGNNVDTKTYEIRNLAASGQYAKGFVDAGQFKPVEYYGKKGDIYIISIGINDTNYSNSKEYTATVTDMVKKAKAKGVTVYLVKQQGRRSDLQKNPKLSGRWFGGELDSIGKSENVKVFDLFTKWQNFGISLGYDKMGDYYAIQAGGKADDLHQSKKGAQKLAEIMGGLLKDAGAFTAAAAPTPTTQATTAKITTTTVTTTIATVPAVQPVVTVSAAPGAVSFPGDANCDGKVNLGDAIIIMQSISNPSKYSLTEQGKINGDVAGNSDGITVLDAQFIQRYCLGLVELPPAVSVPATQPAQPQTTNAPQETTAENLPYIFAIDQKWDQGTAETANEGFTNPKGYLNLDNVAGSSVDFSVNVPQDGNYMTHIRFANGSDNDRKMKVVVNGNTNDYWVQSFTGTGSWTDWTEFGIVLPLKAGQNNIRFESLTTDGGPNLDYITLTLTDEPFAVPYEPEQTPQQQQGPVSDKPTIYIAGDSTVQSYSAKYAPQQGWGYYLKDYFTDNVSVSNQSLAGRSSKKFYDEGRWTTIEKSLKSGDYVMIQFAINDAGKQNADRYAPIGGDIDNPKKGTYEWYMTEFIKGAKSKEATPILVTTTINMKSYSNGKFVNNYGEYCNACKKMAKKYDIPCIDLNTLMVNHYNSIGYNTAKSYHLMGAVSGSTDGTHFCEKGAKAIAGLVAKDVKTQDIYGLAQYVK